MLRIKHLMVEQLLQCARPDGADQVYWQQLVGKCEPGVVYPIMPNRVSSPIGVSKRYHYLYQEPL